MLVKTQFRHLLRITILALIGFILPFSAIAQDNQLTHVVEPGDNLYRISLRYGIDMDALAEANGLETLQNIYPGQSLVIPGMEAADSGLEVDNPLVAATPILHTVQRGESLTTIANKYGITVQQILDANNIANANRINPGDELQIWSMEVSDTTAIATDIPASTSTFTHTVQPGEYLYQIARAYNVSWTTVAELNGITDPNHITPGTELLIPEAQETVADTTTDTTTETIEAGPSATHIVQAGEHLSQIAQQYGVPWTTIAQANNIADPNTVYAGMELTIPGATESLSLGIIADTLAATAPGAYVGTGRELVVRLSTQTAYAYEDGYLMKSSVVSTGLPATPTVQGDYKVYVKYESQTMSGPGYYLPGVPWVMYFYKGYGFHGTYWHNNFGNPMSHGCVNMNNDDAKWFYDFASVGTPVHIIY
ncbi:LysM peptidoglycan-binding domain-containing protein [Phototrophicus methaneseepsis]|uniref:LysM peptidoglycan-binding domain-containing protein n=1 Tax=Phototrophicus methaneseepsis TaxID=2710758 RepID=A0A7S8IDK4_9CHLR|nr:LysM peptidoglycan-binding domain-containing protein [Phototrophicus methaneseepsis]QPC81449.1 LysM peptidoglycan-binding domain-containing protein [Phototrophicus methaneseepsis]